jgi:hypothetical protein
MVCFLVALGMLALLVTRFSGCVTFCHLRFRFGSVLKRYGSVRVDGGLQYRGVLQYHSTVSRCVLAGSRRTSTPSHSNPCMYVHIRVPYSYIIS